MQDGALVLRLRGGLGNQMFQYAAARALADRRQLPLSLDASSGFENERYGRRYELGCFPIRAPILPPSEVPRAGPVRNLRGSLLFLGERIAIRYFGEFFVPIDRFVGKGMVLDNRLQSHRYFADAAGLVRNEFRFPDAPSAKSEIRGFIRDSNSVALHVRLQHGVSDDGQVVFPRERIRRTHNTLRGFYRRALEIVRCTLPNPHIFLFSDTPDVNLCAELENFSVTQVIRDAVEPPWYDMWLMSECRHHIIANSSYSWWAAWLNTSPGKQVFAPRQYLPFESRHLPRNVYPSDWMVL
jgi:hypothetical protein